MPIRQLVFSINAWLFAFLLCMLLTITGFIRVLSSPVIVKNVVNQSGFYQSLVDGILEQSQQQTSNLGDLTDTIPLNRQEIQTAIQTAFPPSLLQHQGEMVIDSLYPWLQGRSSVPDFRINLTAAKASFALAMGKYVQARIAALPACTIASTPAAFDAFNTTCWPSGFDQASEVQKVELEVAGSNTFLPSTILTANTFGGSNGQPLFKQLQALPRYYQTARHLPYIFAVLTVLAAGVGLAEGIDKQKATRRLGSILIGVGLFFMVTSWLFNSLFQHFISSLNAQSSGGFFTQRFTLIFDQADKALNHQYLILGLLCAVAGGAVWLTTDILRFRFKPTSTTSFAADHRDTNNTLQAS